MSFDGVLAYDVRNTRKGVFPWVVSDRQGHVVAGRTREAAIAQYLMLYGKSSFGTTNCEDIEKKELDV